MKQSVDVEGDTENNVSMTKEDRVHKNSRHDEFAGESKGERKHKARGKLWGVDKGYIVFG